MINFQHNVDNLLVCYLTSHPTERLFWKVTQNGEGVWEARKGQTVTMTNIPCAVGDRLIDSGVLAWHDKEKGKDAFVALSITFSENNDLHASGEFYLSMLQQSRPHSPLVQ